MIIGTNNLLITSSVAGAEIAAMYGESITILMPLCDGFMTMMSAATAPCRQQPGRQQRHAFVMHPM